MWQSGWNQYIEATYLLSDHTLNPTKHTVHISRSESHPQPDPHPQHSTNQLWATCFCCYYYLYIIYDYFVDWLSKEWMRDEERVSSLQSVPPIYVVIARLSSWFTKHIYAHHSCLCWLLCVMRFYIYQLFPLIWLELLLLLL